MSFPDEIKKLRYFYADRRCECVQMSHGHIGRCGAFLVLQNLGRNGRGAWEAAHVIPEDYGGDDEFDNCRVYCWACYEKTVGR